MPNGTESLLRDASPRGAEASLELAHFGKHAAWDDHMEHIGAETESILSVKHALYVQGIGEELNRGSWSPLEKEGSALPFDHEFVWSRGEDAIFGAVTSSKDARGRTHYPLVAVCHARGYPLEGVTSPVLNELTESLSRLQSAQSRDTAKRLLQGIQGRFRKLSPDEDDSARTHRLAFLDAPEMAPDRQGFYRILHVLLAATAFGKQEARLHLRVPLFEHFDERKTYGLWRSFLQTALGSNTLILLVRPRSEKLIDVLIGPPRANSFFCLRAGSKNIAFTHEAPYSIGDETRNSADALFERFLSGEAPFDPTQSTWTRLFKRLRT